MDAAFILNELANSVANQRTGFGSNLVEVRIILRLLKLIINYDRRRLALRKTHLELVAFDGCILP